jgi:hypothetical protein
MPDRSHARWTPPYKAGNIGDNSGDAETYQVARKYTHGSQTGDSSDPRNRGRPYDRTSEDRKLEHGAPSRYCNPPGFHGLHGNMAGKNSWQREGGVREVKRRVDAGPRAVPGQPFTKRGSKGTDQN